MAERFAIADLHLGHEACCTRFVRLDGSPLRPFASADEMDEEIVKRWNAVVGPKDRVEVLGDAVIARKNLHTLGRLNGRKRLVAGNHDLFSKDYPTYFDEVVAYKVYVDDFIMSHIPLHPDHITARFKVNVHGHLHDKRVMRQARVIDRVFWNTMTVPPSMVEVEGWASEIDPRYLCVSVEHTNYAPLSFDEVRTRIRDQQDA